MCCATVFPFSVDESRAKTSSQPSENKSSEGNTCNKDSNNEKTVESSERVSTDSVKVEVKEEFDVTRPSLNSCQQAPGGNLQPLHAANAKHSVCVWKNFISKYYSLHIIFRRKRIHFSMQTATGIISFDCTRSCVSD